MRLNALRVVGQAPLDCFPFYAWCESICHLGKLDSSGQHARVNVSFRDLPSLSFGTTTLSALALKESTAALPAEWRRPFACIFMIRGRPFTHDAWNYWFPKRPHGEPICPESAAPTLNRV